MRQIKMSDVMTGKVSRQEAITESRNIIAQLMDAKGEGYTLIGAILADLDNSNAGTIAYLALADVARERLEA